jgi:hypothetical protein
MPDLIFATKGQAAVLRAQQQMAESAKTLAAELKKDSQEADKAKAAILRIYEASKTPQQQMKQRIEELRKITKDAAAPPEAFAALSNLQKKYVESYKVAKQAVVDTKNTVSDLAETQSKTFDAAGVTKWGKALGAAVSAAVVLSFKAIKDEQQKLADDAKSSLVSEGSLAQLANTDKEFQSLLGESRSMYAAGVGRDRNEAAQTLFSLINAGVNDRGDRAFFGRMRSAGLVGNAGDMAKAAATLQSTLGGNMQDIVNRGFGAGAYSPGSIEQLFVGASRGGTGAAALGIGIDELMGSTAALAKATGSEMEAGTLIASLLKSLDKAGGFEGKTLAQSLAEIQKRVAAGEDLRGDSLLGGRQEAVNAFRILTGGGASDFAAATIASGQGGVNRVAATKLDIAESADPSLRAARLALQQEQTRANREIDEGTAMNIYNAQREERIGRINEMPNGIRQVMRALEFAQAYGLDTFMDTEATARNRSLPWIPALEGPSGTPAQQEQQKIFEVLDKQRRAADESNTLQTQQLEAIGKVANKIGELVAKANDGGIYISND